MTGFSKIAVTILGNGRWGQALARLSANRGHGVTLWGRRLCESSLCESMPELINSDDLAEAVVGREVIIMALPCQAIESVCCMLQGVRGLSGDIVIISASKGMQIETRLLPSQIIAKFLPKSRIAVLAGPNFADEIIVGLPAAAVIAGSELACDLGIQVLGQKSYRLYRGGSCLGVEICAVVKNIIAIACGICQGLGLGDNAKAAVMTRGLLEMQKLVAAHSGLESGEYLPIIAGLAGIGDLSLTCGSLQSRNMAFGYALGQGKTFEQAYAESRGVCEGVHSIKPILDLGVEYRLDLPIIRALFAITSGQQGLGEAIDGLLSRPLP